MAGTANGELTRVTIVSPNTRVDLALPAEVPLAELLPTVLRHAGEELADEGAAHGGWVLARLGGQPLDSGRSTSQLSVRDGELLYLTMRQKMAPEMVFDDVIEAVATATNNRGSRWDQHSTRRFSLTVGVSALLSGALAVLFSGPPQLFGAITAFVVATALLSIAAVFARALRATDAAVAFAMVSLAYAGVGGALAGAGDRTFAELTAANLVIAASSVLVFAVMALVAVADRAPLFLSASFCAVALGIASGASMVLDGNFALGAAIVAGLAFALIPMTPMLSLRLARVPMPQLPSNVEELKSDSYSVNGAQALERSTRANEFLTSMYGTIAVISFGCCIALSLDGGVPGWILTGVLSAVLLSRARALIVRSARIPLLTAGIGGLGMLTLAVFVASSSIVRLSAVLGALLVITLIAVFYGLAVTGKRISPVWGRTLDIIEVFLIVAIVPLAGWIGGLYAWMRSLNG
ncbi:type VII secretion integral membrane protein EccD [Phytomonospora endophytica]|uniref:Type VII secretion integral membrane protein EccD n=1 Tax=Phytomonospora endophytica TaxID=714109 RepID=A0A841F767_9ACTN|nr:type VII secretion integral membrane protein EccD [Phytomonospora endophytica]MBB6032851.1 type VII secretion integral membrane protein EccD [Phytomonospora endophytica]GIG65077.1 type VII secretion integral membrane protein EccD [Phytomonospora endophytica]